MLKVNKIPKVLMLGWEFPPIINGGLGIACHDLAIAMSDLAHITMVIPKSSPNFLVRNVELIGLNNVNIDSIKTSNDKYEVNFPGRVFHVPSDMNPYFQDFLYKRSFDEMTSLKEVQFVNESVNGFNIDSLYGNDLLERVVQFGKLVAKLAEVKDFDIVHAHDWMTMLAGMEIKARTGKPLVVHIHSLEVDRSGTDNKGWVYELEKKGMENADLLIPVSNFTAENIHRYYGISKDKIVPVHNGISKVTPFKSQRLFDEPGCGDFSTRV